jgi:3-dehydroquinate synthase
MKIATKDYSIHLHQKALGDLNTFLKTKKFDKHFIVCDTNTLQNCLPLLLVNCKLLRDAEIIELEPGEDTKDLVVVNHIWQTLTEHNCTKNTVIVNLGGGVVSDIGGFAASTFKRGIPFINVPTTLLAMADASVGGKTGINFSGIKNHIGTITQPLGVFIYTPFLQTLSEREVKSGFAEIIKMALIKDKAMFYALLTHKEDSVFYDEHLIARAIELKQAIVKKDPTEKDIRKLLNFGHSVGHALESVFMNSKAHLLHGEAVGIGMMLETYLCYVKKLIPKNVALIVIHYLNQLYKCPVLKEEDWKRFHAFLKQDKKNSNKALQFVLLSKIGMANYNITVTETQLQKAIAFYNTELVNGLP